MEYGGMSPNRTVYASPPEPLLLFCICMAIYKGNRLATDFYCIFAAKICNSKKKKMIKKTENRYAAKSLSGLAKCRK
jgi:hypothetical protein